MFLALGTIVETVFFFPGNEIDIISWLYFNDPSNCIMQHALIFFKSERTLVVIWFYLMDHNSIRKEGQVCLIIIYYHMSLLSPSLFVYTVMFQTKSKHILWNILPPPKSSVKWPDTVIFIPGLFHRKAPSLFHAQGLRDPTPAVSRFAWLLCPAPARGECMACSVPSFTFTVFVQFGEVST